MFTLQQSSFFCDHLSLKATNNQYFSGLVFFNCPQSSLKTRTYASRIICYSDVEAGRKSTFLQLSMTTARQILLSTYLQPDNFNTGISEVHFIALRMLLFYFGSSTKIFVPDLLRYQTINSVHTPAKYLFTL